MNRHMQNKQATTGQILRIFRDASMRTPGHSVIALLLPISTIFTSIGIPFFAIHALTSLNQAGTVFRNNMIGLCIVSFLAILGNRIGFSSVMTVQSRTMDYLHRMMFERLLKRGISFHTNQIGGKLVSDALDFITAYSNMYIAIITSALSFGLTLFVGLIVLSLSSWPLGLFVLIIVASTLLLVYRESRKRSKIRSVRLIATKNLTSHLSDTIVNAQTVKTFGQEAREIEHNHQLNKILFELRLRDWGRAGKNGNNRSAALILLMIGMLLVIKMVAEHDPNIVATGLFAFTYTFTLLLRLFDLNTLTRQIEESLLQAGPMTQILSEDDEVKDKTDAQQLEVSRGVIELDDVAFSYAEKTGQQQVFDGFKLTIPSGQKIGVVGPSGGGKTTLTRLLLRFEDVTSGAITIDGTDITEVTQVSLRQRIAYVPQEPLLFHRSIAENIGYGKPDASMADIRTAARQAYALEFIESLPAGFDTIVGERGVKLSGGQRQRVAIARAIIKDAPILILDEATSALDSESEVAIQAALQELMKGRTTLVIAHRLSTIQRLDRIIVLEQGAIVEDGSHQQLLKQKGLYARLWAHQSGGFLEE